MGVWNYISREERIRLGDCCFDLFHSYRKFLVIECWRGILSDYVELEIIFVQRKPNWVLISIRLAIIKPYATMPSGRAGIVALLCRVVEEHLKVL